MALQVHFTGLNLAKDKGVTRGDLVEAINFFLDSLISKRLKNSLTIFVNFTNSLPILAECVYLDDLFRPKEYEITIKINENTSYRSFMMSLAHELVHVKQYATGEMRHYSSTKLDIVSWKKEKYDMTTLDYWFTPWEIEAHGLESGLYAHLQRHIRKQKNKNNNSIPVTKLMSYNTSIRRTN